MIRTEIRFKNSEFIKALNEKGYESIVEFSRKSGISYGQLIEYANLRIIPKDNRHRKLICDLLEKDEWTLFIQYEKVVEKNRKMPKKIVKEIPIDKIMAIDSPKVLSLESPDLIEDNLDLNRHYLEKEMKKTMSTLKIREQDILKRFFGFGKFKGRGEGGGQFLSEIGKEFNIGRERVRQIKEKALRRMRHRYRANNLSEFL
jgi:DNA-directed RNA polymerase sigma subunit (sigma70/sigma32)